MPKRKDPNQPYFPAGGGQGMIARPAAFMADQERYPRGYTPKRQRDVNRALWRTRIPRSRGGAVIRETIARSSIPTDQLRRLSVITEDHPQVDSTLAEYQHSIRSNPFDTSRARWLPSSFVRIYAPAQGRSREDANQVGHALIHELGHHVENLPYLDSGRAQVSSSRRRAFHVRLMGDPTSEAFAENFAYEHFRPDERVPAMTEDQRSGYDKALIGAWTSPTQLDSVTRRWSREYARTRNLSRAQFLPPRTRPAKGPNPNQMSIDEIEPHQYRLF